MDYPIAVSCTHRLFSLLDFKYSVLDAKSRSDVLVGCIHAFPPDLLPYEVYLFGDGTKYWYQTVDRDATITTPKFQISDNMTVRDVVRSVFSLLFELSDAIREYDAKVATPLPTTDEDPAVEDVLAAVSVCSTFHHAVQTAVAAIRRGEVRGLTATP